MMKSSSYRYIPQGGGKVLIRWGEEGDREHTNCVKGLFLEDNQQMSLRNAFPHWGILLLFHRQPLRMLHTPIIIILSINYWQPIMAHTSINSIDYWVDTVHSGCHGDTLWWPHPQSCLEMRDKTVGDCMTPLESVFMLNNEDCIGTETMDKVGQQFSLCKNDWNVLIKAIWVHVYAGRNLV